MHEISEMVSTLPEHPFWTGIDQEQIAKIAPWSIRVEFLPEQYLCHARHAAQHVYLTLSGRVGLGFDHPSEGFRMIQTVDAPAVVGISWLSQPYKSCYDAKALTEGEAVTIDAVRLREALETDHALARQLYPQFVSVLIGRLQASSLQLFELFECCNSLRCPNRYSEKGEAGFSRECCHRNGTETRHEHGREKREHP